MPVRFLLRLTSVIVGIVAVAFYLNGNGAVAVVLAIVALAIRLPYVRRHRRKREMSTAI
jgi:hypothetical protein